MKLIYSRVSVALAMLPATSRTIAEHLSVEPQTVTIWMRQLRYAGIVRLGEFRQRDGRVHVLCDRDPVEGVSMCDGVDGLERFVAAWRLLRSPQSTDSLADAIGCSRRTTSEIVKAMRTARLVRIARWEMRNQCLTACYDRLPAPDVPRPAPQPRKVSNARYWTKWQARQREAAA